MPASQWQLQKVVLERGTHPTVFLSLNLSHLHRYNSRHLQPSKPSISLFSTMLQCSRVAEGGKKGGDGDGDGTGKHYRGKKKWWREEMKQSSLLHCAILKLWSLSQHPVKLANASSFLKSGFKGKCSAQVEAASALLFNPSRKWK